MPGGGGKRSRSAVVSRSAAVSLATAALLTGPLLLLAPTAQADDTEGGSQMADVLAAQTAPSEMDAFLAFLNRLAGVLSPPSPPPPPPPLPPPPPSPLPPPPPPPPVPSTVLAVVPISVPVSAPASTRFLRPVPGDITSVFGLDGSRIHKGVDLDGETGDLIRAAQSGVIADTSCGSGFGICTIVDHGRGLTTVYAHMSEQAVTSGPVARGQVIGLMGCTGSCTGSHLHFEVRVDGVPQDPMRFL